MEKYCISLDWLQTFCHATQIAEGSYSSRGYNFIVKKEDYETAQFKDIYTVVYQSHPAATIQQTPRTSVINPLATCVKLSNRVLYCEQYINILYAIAVKSQAILIAYSFFFLISFSAQRSKITATCTRTAPLFCRNLPFFYPKKEYFCKISCACI